MATNTPPITTPPILTVEFTVTDTPAQLSAVYNPVRVEVKRNPYKIGDLFFVEIYTSRAHNAMRSDETKVFSILLNTLTKNGDGLGTASFDLGPSLSSAFSSYSLPSSSSVQKDDSAWMSYYFKAGYITFDATNGQIKNYEYESDMLWTLRAAVPLSSDPKQYMEEYLYKYDDSFVRPLTNMPEGIERRRSEPTYISTFISFPTNDIVVNPVLRVYAEAVFHSQSALLDPIDAPINGQFQIQRQILLRTFPLTSGGVIMFDVAPNIFSSDPYYPLLKSYTAWITYQDDTTEETTVTVPKMFRVGPDLVAPVEVKFLNRMGTWECVHFTKNKVERIKTTPQTFRSSTAEKVSRVDSSATVVYNSPWFDNSSAPWLKDLILSPAIMVNGAYVRVESTNFEMDTDDDLFSLQLTVSPEYDENVIKL